MNRMDARFRRGSFRIAALLFVCLAWLTLKGARLDFSAIHTVFSRGSTICGVNRSGTDSDIFLVSADTGAGSFFRMPVMTDEGIISFDDPYIAEDGVPYFTKRLLSEDGTITEQRVFWNLKRNRLENAEEKPPSPATAFDDLPEGEKKENVSVGAVPSETEEVSPETLTPEESFEVGGPAIESYMKQILQGQFVPELKVEEKEGKVQLELKTEEGTRVITGVQRYPRDVLIRLFLSLLAAVLLYWALRGAAYIMAAWGKLPWLMVNLSCFAALLMLLILPCMNQFMRRYIYAFGCRNVLFHCKDAAAQQGEIMDPAQLEKLVSPDRQLTKTNLDALWRAEGREYIRQAVEGDGSAGDISDAENPSDPNEEKKLKVLVQSEEYCVVFKTKYSMMMVSRDANGQDSFTSVPEGTLHRLLEQVFEDGRVRSYMSVLSSERYAEVFVPVELDSGNKVLVGARMPVSGILLSLYRQRKMVLRTCYIVGILMLLAMIFAILRSLRPLSNLTDAVAAFAGGDLSARAEPKGQNEIAYTARCFNEMADTLEKQSAGAESYRRFYEAFLPADLLRRFSGKSLLEALEPGSGYGAPAVCMAVRGTGAGTETSAFFGDAIRISREDGGGLASLTEKGLKLVYPDSEAAALRSAVALEQSELKKGRNQVFIGIAQGPVRLFVSGSTRRRTITDNDPEEAAALGRMAQFLNIPVIVTEKILLDLNREAGKFHFRCLGRVSAPGFTPDGPLYELLDADRPENKEAKERTKKIFEHGIQAYAAGDYFTARNDMIRVMEDNPEDRAAKIYILNCDRKEPPSVCQTEF